MEMESSTDRGGWIGSRARGGGRRVPVRVLAALAPVVALALATACGQASPAAGGDGGGTAQEPAIREVILATTTSTQDSGLLDALLPSFQEQSGYVVKPIAVGTGQAIQMGERGEADVLLVHAPELERPLIEKGAAVDRRLVMHNDFVLVGPAGDPAGVRGARSAAEALAKIAATGSLFVSRGDESGTHVKEKAIWKEAGVEPSGAWYQEAGAGMGQTLQLASEKDGYTLTDRATFLALKKNLAIAVLLEGDAALLNLYHVLRVNPERFPRVNAEGGRALADFFLAPETQRRIGEYGVDEFGEPLFFPDGGKTEELLGGK